MLNGQDLQEIGKTAGSNWPILVVGFLILLDKAGYYLKRKGSNGGIKKEDLVDAIRIVIQERENGSGPPDNDTREIALLPGRSDQCLQNAKDITELKTIVPFVRTEVKNLSRRVGENYTSVKKMFSKIEGDLKVIRTNGKTET